LTCRRVSIVPLYGHVKPLYVPACFHHPMIDDIVVAAVKIELESLQDLASVQSLTATSARQRKENKKIKWGVLYDKCEMRLVANSTGVHIDGTSLLPVRYEQALSQTMRFLGLWEQYWEEPLHQQIFVVRRSLYLVFRIKYCMDVLGVEG
jgi:hypothetical protein